MTRHEQFVHLCRCRDDLQYYYSVAERSPLFRHKEIAKNLEAICNSIAFQLIDYIVISFDKELHGMEIVDDASTRGLFIKFKDGRVILRTYNDEIDSLAFVTMAGPDLRPASQAMIDELTRVIQLPDITW